MLLTDKGFSSGIIQSTVFVNVEKENTGTSKPHFVNSSNIFQKEERHYNKLWEQKYNWLEYSDEKGGTFYKLCQNFMKNDVGVFFKRQPVINIVYVSFHFIQKSFRNKKESWRNMNIRQLIL